MRSVAGNGGSAARRAFRPLADKVLALSEFHKRVLSAAVMLPPVVAAVYLGAPWFTMLIVIFAAAMLWEWLTLARSQMLWLVPGTAYILAACYMLFLMRGDGVEGRNLILFLFVVTWATDTGAYIVGRAAGGPKLAPRISPSKTISGAVGGLLIGVGAGILIWWATGGAIEPRFVLAAVLGSVACQIGDLLESGAKRHFQVKDSGRLIPGHGGVLDRVDGLLAAALAVAATGVWR